MHVPLEEHNLEIEKNLRAWSQKPLLRRIYGNFHTEIAGYLWPPENPSGSIVEIGSGIGNIKEVIPSCLRTDLFPNPWIDRVENAYALSFTDNSVSTLILFDVFHHLQYPGSALKEFNRVLAPGGRVIIFDPYISIFGWIVFGLFHHEPIGWGRTIEWFAPAQWRPVDSTYYAAQGNATRIFFREKYPPLIQDWRIVERKLFSAFSYVASGGYSKPQLYPDGFYPLMRSLDGILDKLPVLFATRLLIVLEKSI